MECVTALDNIVAFVQGEVDETLRREIATHIRNCPRCRREANEVRRTLKVMREAGEDFTPSSRVWMQLMARIKAVMAGLDDGFAGGAADTVEPYDRDDAALPGRMSPGVPLTPGRKVMAIAICAAAVAILVGLVLMWRTTQRFAVEYKGGATVYGPEDKPAGAGEKFFVGDGIRVKGSYGQEAQIVYPNGTKLYLSAPAEARFEAEDTVYLVSGSMRVVISGEEERFTVKTDYGSAVATKAAFEIEVDKAARKTSLSVKVGQVDFANAGTTQLAEAGKKYEAREGRSPEEIEKIEVGRAVVLDKDHNYAVGLAVFDPAKRKFVDPQMGQTVVLNAGSKVRLRFRVTNREDFAIRFPSGNALIDEYETAIIKSEQDPNLRLKVRDYFDEAKESPRPDVENKIKLGNNERYEFYCEVAPEALGLKKPGETVEIYGLYGVLLNKEKTNRIKIRLAAPPPGGEDGPEE